MKAASYIKKVKQIQLFVIKIKKTNYVNCKNRNCRLNFIISTYINC